MNDLFNGNLSGDEREKEAAYCAGFSREDYDKELVKGFLAESEKAAIRMFHELCRNTLMR